MTGKRKTILLSILLLVATIFMVAPVSAVVIAPCDNPNLVSKDSNWNVTDGACGYLYVDTGGKFTFYGYGLDSGTAYSLIYYPDNDAYPWNSAEKGLKVFGTAPCINGRVTISDSGFWTGIPSGFDTNEGIKVWLVPTSDVATDHMTAWNPEQYLFEEELFPVSGEICPDEDVLPNDSDLCQKEILVGDSNPWPVIAHGAHAVMTYDGKMVSGLKAYRLEPYVEYTLIYYPDLAGNPYPNHPIVAIKDITSDAYGYASEESIAFNISAEPLMQTDINYDTERAVKFWLVPEGALNDTETGINWNSPASFLFERELIGVVAPETAQRGGGSGRQHRANINLDDDATFIPLTGAYAGFEEYLQFSISDSRGVDEVLSAYMRGGEISFPGPIPGPLQNGQCVMDYPYIISGGTVQQSAVWGSGLATDVYMTNPGKKIRLNVWKRNNLPSEMTFMVYDKNKEHLLYEETFDVKKQMFDISFELPTGVVSDMIEPWE